MTGNARVGATRHAVAARGDDFYETPECATRTLLRHEELPRLIWEPCAGYGAIKTVLEDAGHDVVAMDLVRRGAAGIEEGIDFLMETRPPAGVECVVTNPPYKLGDQFIRHALSLCPTVIMLLRWAYAEGAGRSDIIDDHLSHVWLGIERLPMMHRNGWTGPTISNAGQPFAWFVFQREPETPGAFTVRRVSWRDASEPAPSSGVAA